jgi:hypothetical protein
MPFQGGYLRPQRLGQLLQEDAKPIFIREMARITQDVDDVSVSCEDPNFPSLTPIYRSFLPKPPVHGVRIGSKIAGGE